MNARPTCDDSCKQWRGCQCQFPITVILHPDTPAPRQPMPAEACTHIGAEPGGKHMAGLLGRLWLRLVRALT